MCRVGRRCRSWWRGWGSQDWLWGMGCVVPQLLRSRGRGQRLLVLLLMLSCSCRRRCCRSCHVPPAAVSTAATEHNRHKTSQNKQERKEMNKSKHPMHGFFERLINATLTPLSIDNHHPKSHLRIQSFH